jgi:hypothetical protein
MIMERQKSINEAEDYVVRRQCGCCVTFLGSCFHRTSRLEACILHNKRDQTHERDQIVAEAKRELQQAKLRQPPR